MHNLIEFEQELCITEQTYPHTISERIFESIRWLENACLVRIVFVVAMFPLLCVQGYICFQYGALFESGRAASDDYPRFDTSTNGRRPSLAGSVAKLSRSSFRVTPVGSQDGDGVLITEVILQPYCYCI